jgi:hypothetical protein
VHELVIVIPDLYLQADAERAPDSRRWRAEAPQPAATPGLDRLGRFARRVPLERGWRAWAADWLGLGALSERPPASVAAASLIGIGAGEGVWLATPMHLLAGLTGVHLDRRSILRPPRAELERLAAQFASDFRDSGFALHALESGELLLSARSVSRAVTTEPARLLLGELADALPRGAGAAALRRLGAELEMWLHAHALNEERARRGAPPISTLWVWGGGEPALTGGMAARAAPAAIFGSNSYLHGLLALLGATARPLPADSRAAFGYAGAERALCVLEVAEVLDEHPRWSLGEAMAAIDARLIAPALSALERGELARLTVLANDRRLALRPLDRWRLWRRRRRGLEALA